MGHLGLRVDDGFEYEFCQEAMGKGLNKSDYLKEILYTRHQNNRLTARTGLLLPLPQSSWQDCQAMAKALGLSLENWICQVLLASISVAKGLVYTDTSLAEQRQNLPQVAGEQTCTDVNVAVNALVNGCTQAHTQKTTDFVNTHLSPSLAPNPETFQYLNSLDELLGNTSPAVAFELLHHLQTLLHNTQHFLGYYYDTSSEPITPSDAHQLLYAHIPPNERAMIEAFIQLLNH